MEQEHRIAYKAGITRTPSDFLCSDGELAECINLTTDNEELKPVVQPAEYITSYSGITGSNKPEFVYVHKVANQDNYIGYIPDDSNKLCYGTVNNKVYTNLDTFEDFFWQPGTSKITSTGKTLIVSDSNGLHYYKWDFDNIRYNDLGEIPSPNVELLLVDVSSGLGGILNSGETEHRSAYVRSEGSYFGILTKSSGSLDDWRMEDNVSIEKYNDLLVGLYKKNKKVLSQKKCFCEPFFVRVAIELYDGSFHFVSQPILMFPSITSNSYGTINELSHTFRVTTFGCKLHYINKSHYEEWTDIVKDIVLFISDGINIYDTTVDQPMPVHITRESYDIWDGIYRYYNSSSSLSEYHTQSIGPEGGQEYIKNYIILNHKPTDEIEKNIVSTSVFYKLCTIGRKYDNTERDIDERINTHTLENISTQDRIDYDDYFSRSTLYPKFMYLYNNRLNLANVRRSMFEGYGFFMPFDNESENTYKFYVTINTDSGTKLVCHTESTKQKQGIWFYYPDSRASHVMIFKGSDCILDEELTEHQNLNGAYYFKGLPESTEPETAITGTEPEYTVPTPEFLPNYIVTSEVNNPWVFKVEGYNKVGTGIIIGISTITQALSQGQFGQYPLLVFSESGIWAMTVDNTGLYQSITPMSREICINPTSITQTDGAVFFVSKKGLMMIVGNEVICVSEQMNGQTFNTASLSPLAAETDWASVVTACQGDTSFLDYIRDSRCFLAYDYTDSRILIINSAYGYAYIYGMKDGTLSKTILPQVMHGCVSNYPDNLLLGSSKVYSFYEKPREEEVSQRQLGFLLTRPMKLAGPVSQASLRQLMNVGTWDPGTSQSPLSKVETRIYLSSDMRTWYKDISRFGAAAKYYRLALFIKMLPTERLSGTILTTQERRNKNMR